MLGVPRLCAMLMEVNSNISWHGHAQGCKTGPVGPCHVRPSCPSLWEWRLIAVFQGTSTCMHCKPPRWVCKPPRWVSHASVPCEGRLTALFQGMGTSKGCKTGLAGPCHERPPYPSLWQRRLTEVFQGMSTACTASPRARCPTLVCHANGG